MAPTPGDAGITRSVERFSGRTVNYFPGEALLAAYRRRGPITVVGRNVFLLGPEANRFVSANPELFGWREAFEGWIPLQGDTTRIVSGGAEHRHCD